MSDNIEDLFRGDLFPDLEKAKAARKLTDFIKDIKDKDVDPFEIVNEEKTAQRNRLSNHFKNFFLSNKRGIQTGNKNSCDEKEQYKKIGSAQDKNSENQNRLELPNPKDNRLFGSGRNKTKLPETRSAGPTTSRRRPPTLQRFKTGKGVNVPRQKQLRINTVQQYNDPVKSQRNFNKFIRAQAGDRRTTLGDRAVVISGNGTPFYGDSYLDRATNNNLSANLATSTPPIDRTYRGTTVSGKVAAKAVGTNDRPTIAPKNNTAGNLLALGAVAAAITAVMFLIQYVVGVVQFIMNIQLLVSNYTNLSRSFISILGAVGSLIGLEGDVTKPLEETVDGLLNNVFGIEKVEYVKLLFAKISNVFVAGYNLTQTIGSSSERLGSAIEEGANNTSKIGNGMRAAGWLGDKYKKFNEAISARKAGKFSQLNDSLEKVGGFSSDLEQITSDVKSFNEEQKKIDKEIEENQKKQSEADKKDEENKEPETSLPNIPRGLI